MDLNVKDWKEFQIGRIFKTNIAKSVDYSSTEPGNNLYIGRTSENNGVQGKVSNQTVEEGNCIIIGMVGENWAFYQTQPFVASQNIFVLRNKHLNHYTAMFLCSVLNKCVEVFRDTYSLPLGKEKMNVRNIKLPVKHNSDGSSVIDENKTYSDDGHIPDWEFMENFIKTLNCEPPTTKNKENENSNIKIDDWKEFKFGNLISEIYKAKALNKEDLLISDEKSNSIRYITRTSEDNGCEFRAVLNEINPSFVEKENAISIGDTTATCFYQSEKFITGDHMVVVRADWLNKINALFIVAILNKENYKYSYGRAFLMDRIKDTIIKLPVKKNADGTAVVDSTYKYSQNGYIPDWKLMENYIKSLPYGDRI